MWCVANAAHVKQERVAYLRNRKFQVWWNIQFCIWQTVLSPCYLFLEHGNKTAISHSLSHSLSICLSVCLDLLLRISRFSRAFCNQIRNNVELITWIQSKKNVTNSKYQGWVGLLIISEFLRGKSYCSHSQNGSQIRECEMSAGPDPKNRFYGFFQIVFISLLVQIKHILYCYFRGSFNKTYSGCPKPPSLHL